ncbi:hypothetical protein [Streptomyces sp. NRRL F-5630]|uniref:hypothetical protein n=1 Tax=Streptomyces sp. NRRL F-5630 TaxID=1463864 RepID=UPI003D731343
MHTVTVRSVGPLSRRRFVCEYSQLPGRVFGPWDLPEMVRDLRIAALLPGLDARDLVLEASAKGSATTHIR